MCLILDANMYGLYVNKHEDMCPARKWVEAEGKIAYSPTEKFAKELHTGRMKDTFAEYRRSGKLKKIDKEEVEQKEKDLTGLKSDDPHIIALAIVGKVKLLVSADEDLHTDFKNIVGGKVYQNAQHKRLLKADTCP
ncbi:hypothetical protein SPBRAN_234 [uncultured Candidatus Thioglobus sp.]|nr:hypothetical protein SPBRAN_234 [uncultured Candidatus Thioglobus sp.]